MGGWAHAVGGGGLSAQKVWREQRVRRRKKERYYRVRTCPQMPTFLPFVLALSISIVIRARTAGSRSL